MKVLVLWLFLALIGLTLAKDKVHFEIKSKTGRKLESEEIRQMLEDLQQAINDLLKREVKFDGSNGGRPYTFHYTRSVDEHGTKSKLIDLFKNILSFNNVKLGSDSHYSSFDDVEDNHDEDKNGGTNREDLVKLLKKNAKVRII